MPVIGPEVYTKSEFYAGTDTLMGRSAYIERLPNKSGGVDSEYWYIPELGVVPVRERVYNADGSLQRTEEPYELEFVEPDPTLVHLPDFPAANPEEKR